MDITENELYLNPENFNGFNNDELVKIQGIMKEMQLTEEEISEQWEFYAIKNKINDKFLSKLDAFKTHLKSNKSKLAKKVKLIESKIDDSFSLPDIFPSSTSSEPVQTSKSNKNSKITTATTASTSNNSSTSAPSRSSYKPNKVLIDVSNKKNEVIDRDSIFDIDPEDLMDIDNNQKNEKFEKQKKNKLHLKINDFSYENRSNVGNIVLTYNKQLISEEILDQPPFKINIESVSNVNKQIKYKSATIESRNKSLVESNQHYTDQFSVPLKPEDSDSTRRVMGRVWVDDQEIQLSKRFALLGSNQNDLSTFTLESSIKEFSLFSGQVVMIEGKKVPGANFFCSNIYYPKALPFMENEKRKDLAGDLDVFVVSGPYFTYQDNDIDLEFKANPFKDLIDLIVTQKPHVAILMGPFIDEDNMMIRQFHKTYDQLFKEMMLQLNSECKSTQILVVPSLRDVNNDYEFPQPPFTFNTNQLDKNNLHFLSNPSTVVINQHVTIGIDNCEIYQHLDRSTNFKVNDMNTNNNPISTTNNNKNNNNNSTTTTTTTTTAQPINTKIPEENIFKMIIEQQSYYPMYPSDIPINPSSSTGSILFPKFTPDILLFANSQKPIIHNVNNVLCMSSGPLVFPYKSGTYLKFTVKKSNSDQPISQRTFATVKNI
ncbi:hypothetical protein DLAC_09234 [Tieghemostelium lacteum]|uniref:DNA polymerase alpha subunit B n=1 Tax=Tieghemostelium lacteum TaxID=361077 RepID=A0A151Z9K5_TIELA|nr:hypothetical protein DLAC_09234 [Tieghemostelium lacteum]|eukprot:KYQ90605.1 hypothetical protein DLAC_09234 [Tieghemostelium lacteum]